MTQFGKDWLTESVVESLRKDPFFEKNAKGKTGFALAGEIERRMKQNAFMGGGNNITKNALEKVDYNKVAKMFGGGDSFNVTPIKKP